MEIDFLILGLEDTLVHDAEASAREPGAGLNPHAVRLIDEALAQGCRLAITTSMRHREASLLLEAAFGDSLHQTVSVVVTEADFDKPSKSNPYELIQRTLGIDSRTCAVVDANVQARLSARRVGMHVFNAEAADALRAMLCRRSGSATHSTALAKPAPWYWARRTPALSFPPT